LLKHFDIGIYSYVQAIGEIAAPPVAAAEVVRNYEKIEASPVRCPSLPAAQKMMAAIDRAKAEGDTLGGVFIVLALGVPAGLGSHVHWDRKLDARLAGALMSIQSVKGVEIGDGFAAAARPGSLVHDEIYYEPHTGYRRRTNHAGGLEGGITNGEPLYCRVAVKPIPTLTKPLASVDRDARKPAFAAVERSDTCVVPAAAVVGEAVVAWELAVALQEKLGGDSLQEMLANYRSYRRQCAGR
jgi:chorismate synthase